MSQSGMTFEVRITRGVRYGAGRVGFTTQPRERDLLMDVYQPVGAAAPRPALVMAFGGAFHRGTRESDRMDAEGQKNTTIAEYCAKFAARGYTAFSIDYRLVPEDPDPGPTPVITSAAGVPRSRVDVVRGILGLPPASFEQLKAGVEAAADDMKLAVEFVRANAARFDIDSRRIALGGFSAGGRTALNVAFGERVPVSAVISISGFISQDDLERHVTGAPGQPQVLLFTGENDLDYVAGNIAGIAAHFRARGLLGGAHVIAGATHFYPAASPVTRADGRASTIEAEMAAFIARSLGPV